MGRSDRVQLKPFKRVINIICPGDVEKAYLEKLKADKYLHGPLILIEPKLGKADRFEKVIGDISKMTGKKTSPEVVFYVNDMDAIVKQGKEERYLALKNRLLDKTKGKVVFVESMPCIEFWFLLHKCYRDSYWASWDDLKPELLKWISDYEKTGSRAAKLYYETIDHQPYAITNAKRTAAKHEENEAACSYTYMHDLIEKLDEVFREKDKA